MAKRRSYAEVLDTIKLPDNIPETINCKMCGQPMQLLKINPYIAFWLHHDEALIKCKQTNMLHPGRPLIAQNMKYYKDIVAIWNELLEDRKKIDQKKNM